MRVAILDPYYPRFLRAVYAADPRLERLPYAEQLDALLGTWFGTSDSYSHGFREAGHEAAEYVINCVPLQLAWARERQLRSLLRHLPPRFSAHAPVLRLPAVRSLLSHILQHQLEEFCPDVIYFQDLQFLPRRQLRELRRRGSLLVGQIASAAPSLERMMEFDLVVTSFPHYVTRYRAAGIDIEYLPLGFDERILPQLESQGVHSSRLAERSQPVVFVGGLNPRKWRAGVAMLEHVVNAGIEIEIYGYGAKSLARNSPILRRYCGETWGLDMYRQFASAQIVVNRHIEVSEGYANNCRLYEATGVGALVLTESAPNLSTLFDPGREIVSYDNPDDLVTKLVHLLDSEDERRSLAQAGQRRTLSEHTYRQRTLTLSDMLLERLG